MNNYQKGFSEILLLGLVGAIVFAGGYFVWQKNFVFDGVPKCEQPQYKPEVIFDKERNEMVFFCHREIDLEKNKCVREYFSLDTGRRVSSMDAACVIF